MAESKKEEQPDEVKAQEMQNNDTESDKLLIVISGITSGIGAVQ